MFSGQIDGVGPFQITPLGLGDLTIPEGTPMAGAVLPVRAFLLAHPQGLLLFDTGLGEEHPAFDRLLRPRRRRLDDALAATGVRMADIAFVTNCHLHYDHAGGNPLFPARPLFVQVAEYEAAGELAYFTPESITFAGADLRILQGETAILRGIRLIPTPGHTPGHQSLLVEARGGPVIVAGQAAYTAAEYRNPHREPARGLKTAYDGQAFLASIALLHALNPQRVYFSHDESTWEPGAD